MNIIVFFIDFESLTIRIQNVFGVFFFFEVFLLFCFFFSLTSLIGPSLQFKARVAR